MPALLLLLLFFEALQLDQHPKHPIAEATGDMVIYPDLSRSMHVQRLAS